MTLLAQIDQETFESLPEAMQEHYAPLESQEGVFMLDVKPVEGIALEDVKSLKESLRKERTESQKLQSQIGTYRNEDGEMLDAEEARGAIVKLKEFEDLDIDAEAEKRLQLKEKQLQEKYEAERRKLEEKHKTEIANSSARIKSLNGQLTSTLVDRTAVDAINRHKGSPKLLLPIVREQLRVKENDRGQLQVEVVDPEDPDGLPRLSNRTGSREYMDVEELVAELKTTDAYARAFDATPASGSGATGAAQRSSGEQIIGGAFRINADDAKDPAKYQAAKKKADERGVPLEIVEPSMT